MARELDKGAQMMSVRSGISGFDRVRPRAEPSERPTRPMPAPAVKVAVAQDSFQSPAVTPSALRRAALQRGMTGGLVRELQRHLVAEGHLRPSEVATGPGVFGPRTENAVRAFQAREGIEVTGMVGPQTWAALLGDGFSPARSETTVTEVPRTLDLSMTRPLETGAPSSSNTRSGTLAPDASRPPGASVH
jgi:peptidoglycan hydrolase-like protein with peptidoglycan-binding domain